MKATVKVENLKIYAYHGCMKEEKIIGSDYVVNVTAECLLKKEAFEDDISKTVDYVDLARIVTREMGVRSKMLESVVKRICSSSLAEISLLNKITVCVSKICPPINADVERVTVCLTEKRNK
jgi:dihydroneopterin aldolase